MRAGLHFSDSLSCSAIETKIYLCSTVSAYTAPLSFSSMDCWTADVSSKAVNTRFSNCR